MQYYTPGCGISSYGQTFPGYREAQQSCPYPKVVGEGDVASVSLPDGTVQLYFVPARCPPQPGPPPWLANSYTEAWYIRSVPDPFLARQANVQNQQYQRPHFQPVTNVPSFQQNGYEHKLGYQVKFHNDNCTSTTDIHYFYPSLRYHEWFPQKCVVTQVEQPIVNQSEPTCSKPCHCTKNSAVPDSETHQRYMCAINENENKRNQVTRACTINENENKKNQVPCKCAINDKDKKKRVTHRQSQTSCSSSPSVEVIHNKKKSARLSRKKSSNHVCECDLPPKAEKSNKAIATVTEQAAGCCADEGRATQTGPPCAHSVPLRKASSFLHVSYAETEFWYPKTAQSKRVYTDTDEMEMSCESCSVTLSERGASESETTVAVE